MCLRLAYPKMKETSLELFKKVFSWHSAHKGKTSYLLGNEMNKFTTCSRTARLRDCDEHCSDEITPEMATKMNQNHRWFSEAYFKMGTALFKLCFSQKSFHMVQTLSSWVWSLNKQCWMTSSNHVTSNLMNAKST